MHAQHPKDDRVSATYAQLLIQQNRVDDASKLNDDLLKSNPKDLNAQLLRGQILIRQGKGQDAVNVLAPVVKDAPDNAFGHYYLGLAYADSSNLGQAETEWREAARLNPQLPDPQRALASLALLKNDNALLVDSSNQVIKLQPRVADGYLFHARAEINNKDLAGAEADLKKAIEVAPRNSTAYVLLGALRLAQKRPDEAANFYIQALGVNPNAADALAGLVNIDLEHKDVPKALKLVQDQISLSPKNSQFYLLLGQLQLRNQDSAKAEQAFCKAAGS